MNGSRSKSKVSWRGDTLVISLSLAKRNGDFSIFQFLLVIFPYFFFNKFPKQVVENRKEELLVMRESFFLSTIVKFEMDE